MVTVDDETHLLSPSFPQQPVASPTLSVRDMQVPQDEMVMSTNHTAPSANATPDYRSESMSSPPPSTPCSPSISAAQIASSLTNDTPSSPRTTSQASNSSARLKHVARDDSPSPRFSKRQRPAVPLTPPSTHASPPPAGEPSEAAEVLGADNATVMRGLHVLQTEALALAHTIKLYQTSADAQAGLVRAVDTIVASQGGRNNGSSARRNHDGIGANTEIATKITGVGMRGNSRGKVLLCGVGKSARVAEKTTATLKSLGVRASFLHATEAVHGDLGDVGDDDVLIILSNSGKTPELLALLPHIPTTLPLIAVTSHTHTADVPLFRARASLATRNVHGNGSPHLDQRPPTPSRNSSSSNLSDLTQGDSNDYNLARYNILLPAPIHETETASFGVNAPTSSTTVSMAVGDMLALTVAETLYGESEGGVKEVFRKNHPGGAIGMDAGFGT